MHDATRPSTPPPAYEATDPNTTPSPNPVEAAATTSMPATTSGNSDDLAAELARTETTTSAVAPTADPSKIHVINYWLVQVDRDWQTGRFGDGTRLYHRLAFGTRCYVLVHSQELHADGTVSVWASDGQCYLLRTEPNIALWAKADYAAWKSWDAEHGADMEEDRPDYEPWAYKSRAGFVDGDSAGIGAFYRGA